MSRRSEHGFTVLEMAITLTIFGFLMLYVSQLMTSQIRLFDTATRQIKMEQKARVSMMHILDEIRLHKSTYYLPGPVGEGVYYLKPNPTGPDEPYCLIDINPDLSSSPPGTGIYLDRGNHNLWFRDTDNSSYLISDDIESIEMDPVTDTDHLIRINIIAKNQRTNETYQLLTWSRLY